MSNVAQLSEHNWRKALTLTKKAEVAKDIGNAVLYLLNDPLWVGCISYDEFSDKTFWAKAPPALDAGMHTVFPAPKVGELISDRDSAYVHHWFARIVGVNFALDTLLRAIEVAAHHKKVSPPRTYLRGLVWDGVPRLRKMFSTYFGAVDSVYTQEVGARWMISAVARIIEPGCKADCLLILQGKQGAKKSSSLAALGGAWYSNSLPDVTSKDSQISLFGSWIIEIPELEAMNRSATSAFKDFSARQFDKFRKPYARFETINQRTCVFAGTTNEEKILSDPTGARRFWPIKVMPDGGTIDVRGLIRDRDQLWAEAVEQFDSGKIWHVDESLQEIFSAEQDERYSDDIWAPQVAAWCDKQERGGADTFTTSEILLSALGVDQARQDITTGARIGKIMRRLGYTMTGRRIVGDRKFSVYAAKKRRLELTGENMSDSETDFPDAE